MSHPNPRRTYIDPIIEFAALLDVVAAKRGLSLWQVEESVRYFLAAYVYAHHEKKMDPQHFLMKTSEELANTFRAIGIDVYGKGSNYGNRNL